jgi:DivIVA domain-containing protein
VATFLTYLLGLLVVGGALFLLASFAFGRGEELAPMPPDGTPVELPEGQFGGAAVRSLRMSVVLRGYRMDEVDWVIDVLADQLDARDAEIARLRRLAGQPPAPEPAAVPAADAAGTAAEPAPIDDRAVEVSSAGDPVPSDEEPARAGVTGAAQPAREDRDG